SGAHLRSHRAVGGRHRLRGAGLGQALAGVARMSATPPVGHGLGAPNAAVGATPASRGVGPPLWLLLGLTYRCPLHCVYCYNPTNFAHTGPELPTADSIRVLREARPPGPVPPRPPGAARRAP